MSLEVSTDMSNYLPQIAEKTAYGYHYTNPFDILYGDRIVFINDVIDDNVAGNVVAQLLALESKDSKSGVTIYLNTPGGSIDSVMFIVDTMNYIQCPVTTVCLGQCSGASSLILVNGAKRLMLTHSRVILRQPAMGAQQDKATDIVISAKELTRLRGLLEDSIAEHTHIKRDEITALTQHETVFTADECLKKGIIDEILNKRPIDDDNEDD